MFKQLNTKLKLIESSMGMRPRQRYQASFQLLVLCEACRAYNLNNLKTNLEFLCQGLNTIIDYFSHPHLFHKTENSIEFLTSC